MLTYMYSVVCRYRVLDISVSFRETESCPLNECSQFNSFLLVDLPLIQVFPPHCFYSHFTKIIRAALSSTGTEKKISINLLLAWENWLMCLYWGEVCGGSGRTYIFRQTNHT